MCLLTTVPQEWWPEAQQERTPWQWEMEHTFLFILLSPKVHLLWRPERKRLDIKYWVSQSIWTLKMNPEIAETWDTENKRKSRYILCGKSEGRREVIGRATAERLKGQGRSGGYFSGLWMERISHLTAGGDKSMREEEEGGSTRPWASRAGASEKNKGAFFLKEENYYWMGPWATWSSRRCPCLWQWDWN